MTTELDEMIARVEATQRRSKRRVHAVAGTLLGLAIATGLGAYLLRERECALTAPREADVVLRARGRKIVIGKGRSIRFVLRPLIEELTVDGPSGSRARTLSLFASGHVFVAADASECFVTVSATSMYGEGARLPSVLSISAPGRDVSSGFVAMDHRVVADVCELPEQKRLMDAVTIVQHVACADVPTREAAQQHVLAKFAACKRRDLILP